MTSVFKEQVFDWYVLYWLDTGTHVVLIDEKEFLARGGGR